MYSVVSYSSCYCPRLVKVIVTYVLGIFFFWFCIFHHMGVVYLFATRSFEELDCRVRDYRRKIREGVVGGDVATVTENWNRSPRESPVAISQVMSQTSANM